jgi:hypothetical protein
MTIQQLFVMFFAYLAGLAVVAYFTRATSRRIVGALAGGAVGGLLVFGVLPLADALGLWTVPMSWTPEFLALLLAVGIVSCAPIYLVTWRVARRFGWRGLAMVLGIAAVIGPPRDYAVAALFPEWIVFGPGLAPIFGIAATYAAFVMLGHAVMRLVAGPARDDRLARCPRGASDGIMRAESRVRIYQSSIKSHGSV